MIQVPFENRAQALGESQATLAAEIERVPPTRSLSGALFVDLNVADDAAHQPQPGVTTKVLELVIDKSILDIFAIIPYKRYFLKDMGILILEDQSASPSEDHCRTSEEALWPSKLPSPLGIS
nr:hypothetical protein Iba_chr01bCG5270 [Ipomoea batatas]